MAFPNRELSQFASFLTINDTNQGISITKETTPFVGIGTTIIDEKLHINGNVKVSGFVTASEYYGDGSTLSGVVGVIDGYFISTPTGIYTGANVGIGTSTLTNKLNVGGSVGITSNLTAYIINSNAPTGIAPFTVQSSTVVSNLNADLFRGRTPPTGNFVGDSDTQTLTNKTLNSPRISTILNGTASLTVPTTSGTLIHSNAVGIITSGVYGNQSILNVHVSNSAAIAYSKLNLTNSIVNADVNVGAAISYTKLGLSNSIKSSDIDPNNKIQNDKLQNNTISGISLGNNLATLTRGSYLTGNNYNGAENTTWGVDASTDNVASTVVARDADGNINATRFIGDGAVPVGSIIYYPINSPPDGFLKANGAEISREVYSELYGVIGTSFGNGNGTTTFNLPDLRGEFIRGWDDGRGIDPGRIIGTSQTDAFKDHYHFISGTSDDINNSPGAHFYNTNQFNTTSSTVTFGQLSSPPGGTETRPRNIALLACIKY